MIGASEAGLGMSIPKTGNDVLTTSLCLIGPDGTGKSVLALHLAARYLADCKAEGEEPPRVLYISTDLTHSMAETVWDNFDLRHPLTRHEPFVADQKKKLAEPVVLGLAAKLPKDMNKVLAENKNDGDEVCFIDLAQVTAGDDWGFVHRILSVIDPPHSAGDPRHLVLLDAVEGFETLVGDLNAFGEKATRRSRIAQVMRLASKKCHLLFVVEESKHERLPEEFVTDLVIRLRNVEINGYVRRTVEIEKARGQTHVRGQHPFVTRSGRGSTTGSDENVNYDDPRVLSDKGKPQSYVQVFTSINHLSRTVMGTTGKPRMEAPKGKYAGFGISYLDTMLGGDEEFRTHAGTDRRGLPCSSVTALIGDALTQKSQLGRAFLSRAFYPFAKALADRVKNKLPHFKEGEEQGNRAVAEFKASVERAIGELERAPLRMGRGEETEVYPLFITDDFRDKENLVKKLKEKEDQVSRYLYDNFQPTTQSLLDAYDLTAQPDEKLYEELLRLLKNDLNRLIESKSLEELMNSAGVRWSEAAVRLRGQENPTGEKLVRLNRLLLEDAYLQELSVEKVPGVAVMMTTQDTHSEELAREFMQWLDTKSLLGIMGGHKDRAAVKRFEQVLHAFEQVLYTHIKDNTICRRMEIHDLSSPIIAHIFQRNIEAAQRKLFDKIATDELPAVRGRFQSSWRIRMVIDDFNAFRNIFPDIHNDPLLLPFLLFHLRREGISTLILDTQSGKPDIGLSERFESSLREVADYRLYTWRIPFYGETRIAITAIPPLSLRNRGLIRELRTHWAGSSEARVDRNLTVDPHFELYAGLERGHPHPVPLEVRLYPGTATLRKYIEDENIIFKELFTPNTGKSEILVGFDPPKYEAFREFCYLQRDTRLDHTLVFQIDEFWLTWLTRQSQTRNAGILQRQWQYLNAVTVDGDGEPDRAADAYYLFQKTFDQSKHPKQNETRERMEGARSVFHDGEARRRNFYDDKRLGYGFEDQKVKKSKIDRVPFLWDFAFLLCRENLWTEYLNKAADGEDDKEKKENVKQVWMNIPRAKSNPETDGERGMRKYAEVPWRNFLAACNEVAEYHSAKLSTPIPAFDFSLDDGEAFSCLVLEIWLSEIYQTMKKRDEVVAARSGGASTRTHDEKGNQAPRLAHDLSQKIWDRWKAHKNVSLFEGLIKDEGKSLTDILKARREGDEETGYSLELYKTWLLLTEVIDFTNLLSTPHNFSFEFKSRQSNPDAVAAHHWYQSACDLIEQHHLAENLVAVRLPGHFSVRGDWFLAVAGGSRSSRLAHRAMDLLSSRRANIKRLQLGIGLPVRKIVENKSDFKHVQTRLISTDDKTGRLKNVSYEEFLSIAGRTKPSKDDEEPDKEFYWLWRSSLYGYARCSRVWQKWLNRMALWWQTIHARHKSVWAPGFDLYDRINKYLDGKSDDLVFPYESWEHYPDMVKILLMELQQVSFGHDRDEEAQADDS
jgi:hypothetical protein